MKSNIGTVDRTLRVVFGTGFALGGWFTEDGGAMSMVFIVVGLALLVTGLMSTCPIYSVAGIETSEKPDARGH
ncbi:MAG: DUF2892 domain-containing protein [Ghiorsea sp.]|nr:DUF2892 domain-containing protein [Ghiorsea sp.]